MFWRRESVRRQAGEPTAHRTVARSTPSRIFERGAPRDGFLSIRRGGQDGTCAGALLRARRPQAAGDRLRGYARSAGQALGIARRVSDRDERAVGATRLAQGCRGHPRRRWRRRASTGSPSTTCSKTTSRCGSSTLSRSRRAGPQDRRPGRPMARPAARARAGARELRAAEADPRAARPDPLSQIARLGARSRGEPSPEAARGREHQTRNVASDVLGASGKAVLGALCEGDPDPEALAELAKGKLRAKLPALRLALEGRCSAHHALHVSHLLSHVEYLDARASRASWTAGRAPR
jgi:hypothetical protein